MLSKNNKLSEQEMKLKYSVLQHAALREHDGVERGSSVVECRTRNRESPGLNPLCYRFEDWAFSFSSRRLSRLSCINEYLAIDSGGNVSE